MTDQDLDRVCKIWLTEVKRAHLLICDKFWDSRLSIFIKETQDADERYVWKENELVVGFITAQKVSDIKAYIPELYVNSQYQGKGIGKKLLRELQDKYSELTLSVYKQNTKAFDWYTKRGFRVKTNGIRYCPVTEFLKLDMIWKKENNYGT